MLTAHVLRGLAWSGAGQVVLRVLQALFSVVLARLLMPRDFGLVGMAMVVTGCLQVLVPMGLPVVVVQQRLHDARSLATAFWMTTAVGGLLAGLLYLGAPAVGWLFDASKVGEVTRWLTPSVLLAGLGAIPTACLNRDMDFRSLAIVGLAGTFVGGLAAISLAVLGYGVWALVAGHLVSVGVTTLLTLRRAPCWRGGRGFPGSLANLLRSGSPLAGFEALNYGATFVDNAAVGRFLGAPALGVYALAYNLATIPQTWIVGVVARVTLPAYTLIREDILRLREAYLRTLRMVALLSFPVLTGLALLAPEAIRVIFGPRWMDTAPILRMLSLLGIATSVMALAGGVLVAQGRGRLMFWWSVWTLAALLVAVTLGVRYGLQGVAVAVSVRAWVMLPILQRIVGRALALPLRGMIESLAPATLGSVGMTIVVMLLRTLWRPEEGGAAFFATGILAGAAAYATVLLTRYPGIVQEFRGLLGQIRQGATAGAVAPAATRQ